MVSREECWEECLGRIRFEVITCGAVFAASLPLAQYAGKLCRVSCATPVLGPLFGGTAVACISIAASQVSHKTRMFLLPGQKEENDRKNVIVELSMPSAFGLLAFKLLGGKYSCLMPSDLRFPGARAKVAIPASSYRYAGPMAKSLIEVLFKRFGCHHCGRKTGESIADHIPPNVLHNTKTRRRLLSKVVDQMFYPQCTMCSQLQSSAVRHGKKYLVLHRNKGKPEPYTFAGVLVGAILPPLEIIED